jgi:transposase
LLVETIAVCDRYKAYHKMARIIGILLAFCWAHVRRDFLKCERSYPQLSAFAQAWVQRIGLLYHLNSQRLQVLTDAPAFAKVQAEITQHLEAMVAARDANLADKTLHAEARKVLESLANHWAGLIVFVDHPEVPLDNNSAERTLRNAVCGYKNYFGSVTKWAGEFAAMMFTVFMTLVDCWQINPRLWMQAYLQACADNGGQPPKDLTPFLPWAMSPERLAFLRGPMLEGNSSIDST